MYAHTQPSLLDLHPPHLSSHRHPVCLLDSLRWTQAREVRNKHHQFVRRSRSGSTQKTAAFPVAPSWFFPSDPASLFLNLQTCFDQIYWQSPSNRNRCLMHYITAGLQEWEKPCWFFLSFVIIFHYLSLWLWASALRLVFSSVEQSIQSILSICQSLSFGCWLVPLFSLLGLPSLSLWLIHYIF